MSDPTAPRSPLDALRDRSYRVLLVLAAIVGVIVSVASWAFLEAVHYAQVWLFEDLPGQLGFTRVPTWWPVPLLLVGGVIVAVAIARLPGRGGHEPSEGLSSSGSPTMPVMLPGVMLAAFATLAFGLVLGPEAPLIALGSGLGVLAIRAARRDAPDQAVAVVGAAGGFAAISSIFGSPIVGAIIVIEAAGLGGPMLPLVLLPGLMAAGIGSLVFVGMGQSTGVSTAAYAITPLHLPAYARPDLAAFGWTLVLGVAAALVVFLIIRLGVAVKELVPRRPLVVVPAAALVVAGLAIAYFEITGEPANAVLFSGQDGMVKVVQESAALSLGTLALLIAFKGLAWGVSLGAARGGPTFPAIFLGIVGGLLAGHLPGFSETPAIAVLIGVACVSVLRLPLSSIIIALIISAGGMGTAPLVILGVVVAFLVVAGLSARFTVEPVPAQAPATGATAQAQATPP